jgi:hypothetical protein
MQSIVIGLQAAKMIMQNRVRSLFVPGFDSAPAFLPFFWQNRYLYEHLIICYALYDEAYGEFSYRELVKLRQTNI